MPLKSKNMKDYTIPAILLVVGIAVLGNLPGCYNNKTEEAKCTYEGRECPNVQDYADKHLRDYQIEVHYDTVWIYDENRLVGTFVNTKWDSKLDSIIINDNL